MDKKYVYLFREGNANMRELLGGKGANLAEMTNLGLPIPQGFTITTEACIEYYNNNENISEEIKYQIFMSLKELERITGKQFGNPANPLLVSVRSGCKSINAWYDGYYFKPWIKQRSSRSNGKEERKICIR